MLTTVKPNLARALSAASMGECLLEITRDVLDDDDSVVTTNRSRWSAPSGIDVDGCNQQVHSPKVPTSDTGTATWNEGGACVPTEREHNQQYQHYRDQQGPFDLVTEARIVTV